MILDDIEKYLGLNVCKIALLFATFMKWLLN